MNYTIWKLHLLPSNTLSASSETAKKTKSLLLIPTNALPPK